MKRHIGCLDGIRGGLALWVFWGHLANAVGLDFPLLRAPALAVDLFMLLSGFLMSWHWESRRLMPDPPPYGERVKDFWLRRFFRIAPLYYPLFFAALWLDPAFAAARDNMTAAFPPVWSVNAPAGAAAPPLLSFGNIAGHLAFAFGLLPSQAANNALPDWSISLEMQFYLVFPALVAFCRPVRIVVFSAVSVAISLVAARLFGVGPFGSGLVAHFPQPSLLLLKIHIFAAGIALGWLGANRTDAAPRSQYWLAFLLPLLVLPKPVWLAALFISALILADAKPVRLVAKVLGSAPFRLGGDLSYGVYLVHLLPSYLLLDLATRHGLLSGLSSGGRFLFAVCALTPPVYGVAYLLHRVVEQPGIEFGRTLAKRIRPRAAPAALPADPSSARAADAAQNRS